MKPISAFALISWGAHGHTHASQTRASLGVLSIAVLPVVALALLLLQKDPTRD